MQELDKKRQDIFGENILKLREARNWSQDEVAKRCRLTKSTISVVENGNRNFSFSTLIAFAKAFEVHPKELLDLDFDLDHEEF